MTSNGLLPDYGSGGGRSSCPALAAGTGGRPVDDHRCLPRGRRNARRCAPGQPYVHGPARDVAAMGTASRGISAQQSAPDWREGDGCPERPLSPWLERRCLPPHMRCQHDISARYGGVRRYGARDHAAGGYRMTITALVLVRRRCVVVLPMSSSRIRECPYAPITRRSTSSSASMSGITSSASPGRTVSSIR